MVQNWKKNSVGFHSCLRVISHPQMSDLVLWQQKYAKITPFLPRNSAIFGYNLSVFQAKFSFLGSPLNAAVVFNAKRAAWVTSKLKTTTAFNKEPKKENYTCFCQKSSARSRRIGPSLQRYEISLPGLRSLHCEGVHCGGCKTTALHSIIEKIVNKNSENIKGNTVI